MNLPSHPRTVFSSHQRLRISLYTKAITTLPTAAPGSDGRPDAILLLGVGSGVRVGSGVPDLLLPRTERPLCAGASSLPLPPS